MAIMDRLDPEIAPIVASFPVLDLSDIPKARAEYNAATGVLEIPANPEVATLDIIAPERSGHPSVRLREFRPKVAATAPLPTILWAQGGGYVMPSANLDDGWCQELALTHQCAVFSVDWRRSPEHPFPAASEDCYTGLSYIIHNAEELDRKSVV